MATAAAAPVIALANTVIIADAGNAWIESKKSKKKCNIQSAAISILFSVGANYVLQTIILTVSLTALYQQSDSDQPWWQMTFVITGDGPHPSGHIPQHPP